MDITVVLQESPRGARGGVLLTRRLKLWRPLKNDGPRLKMLVLLVSWQLGALKLLGRIVTVC